MCTYRIAINCIIVSPNFIGFVESIQKVLVDKGITVAVFETLREYIGEMTRNEQCVEYGCRALRGILMHPYAIVCVCVCVLILCVLYVYA